jgi:hypothetical protein
MLYALRFIKPIAHFRSEFSYQNIFPMLAGEIIQKLAGKTYAENLHQKLFVPLQMNDSYSDGEEKLYKQKDLAQAFAYISGELSAYPMNPSYQSKRRISENAAGGSGGIYSSALDIAKWLIFNMNNGSSENTQLVSRKNMEFIHSPQNLTGSHKKTEQKYGQGWFIDKQEYEPYTLLYHPGGGMGMHALVAYIPEEKMGIVILTNTWGNKVPESLYQRFFDLAWEKKNLKDWSKIYLQEQASLASNTNAEHESRICQKVKKPNLEKYIGTYYNPVFGNLTISKQKEQLLLHIGPIGIVWDLTHCQNDIFKANWPNPYGMKFTMLPDEQSSIEFVEKDKKVHRMVIPFLGNDEIGVFEKIETQNRD